MRASGCFARLGVGLLATAAVLGAGYWLWVRGTMEPATWVVSEVHDGQRTLVVEWATNFAYCAERPEIEVGERDTEIRLQATYRLPRTIDCGLATGRRFPPAIVHLDRPLAGRKLVGDHQADVPVGFGFDPRAPSPTMPEVIGMDAAAARRALSRERYRGASLPSTESVGFVTRQWPLPGTNLNPKGRNPKGPAPRLTFSG